MGIFLHHRDVVKHTLTSANKIHACRYNGCQEWVVVIAGRSVFLSSCRDLRNHLCLHTLTYTHTLPLHMGCIISAHILICVWIVLLTLPRWQHQHLFLAVSRARSSRHAFPWLQLTTLLIDVWTNAPVSSEAQLYETHQETINVEFTNSVFSYLF